MSENLGVNTKRMSDRRTNDGGMSYRKDRAARCNQSIHPSADACRHVSEGLAAMWGSAGIVQPVGGFLGGLFLDVGEGKPCPTPEIAVAQVWLDLCAEL